MSMRLGPTGSLVTIVPEYSFAIAKTKEEARHRAHSGKLYQYLFNVYSKFEIPLNWVSSSDRTLMNSWWETNTNLEFYDDVEGAPSSFFDVRITNDIDPFPSFVRPYFQEFYEGTLVLEEYT